MPPVLSTFWRSAPSIVPAGRPQMVAVAVVQRGGIIHEGNFYSQIYILCTVCIQKRRRRSQNKWPFGSKEEGEKEEAQQQRHKNPRGDGQIIWHAPIYGGPSLGLVMVVVVFIRSSISQKRLGGDRGNTSHTWR